MTTWSSRSIIIGSSLHVTNNIINLLYPPMSLINSLAPMGKRGDYVIASKLWKHLAKISELLVGNLEALR